MRKRFLLLTLAVVGLAGCNQHPASSTLPKENLAVAGEIGSRLPDFSVKDLQGRQISSADLQGKVVLIDFGRHGASRARKRCPAIRSS